MVLTARRWRLVWQRAHRDGEEARGGLDRVMSVLSQEVVDALPDMASPGSKNVGAEGTKMTTKGCNI